MSFTLNPGGGKTRRRSGLKTVTGSGSLKGRGPSTIGSPKIGPPILPIQIEPEQPSQLQMISTVGSTLCQAMQASNAQLLQGMAEQSNQALATVIQMMAAINLQGSRSNCSTGSGSGSGSSGSSGMSMNEFNLAMQNWIANNRRKPEDEPTEEPLCMQFVVSHQPGCGLYVFRKHRTCRCPRGLQNLCMRHLCLIRSL